MFLVLLPYLLLSANTVLFVLLFFGINHRLRTIRTRAQTREAASAAETARMTNAIKELTNRITTLEKEERQLGTMEAGSSGLNSTLRGKVLKMHRLGQPVERIAERLRVPRGEVDLLVKVHAIVMRTYQGMDAPELPAAAAKKA
jgi:hypothetical protein